MAALLEDAKVERTGEQKRSGDGQIEGGVVDTAPVPTNPLITLTSGTQNAPKRMRRDRRAYLFWHSGKVNARPAQWTSCFHHHLLVVRGASHQQHNKLLVPVVHPFSTGNVAAERPRSPTPQPSFLMSHDPS